MKNEKFYAVTKEKRFWSIVQIGFNISGHLRRIFITGDSESGKTRGLLNLINNEPDTDKLYRKTPMNQIIVCFLTSVTREV